MEKWYGPSISEPVIKTRQMKFKLKRIDWYIIKQFLGTYVFAIALIISISVVFDINEKIDKFLNPDVPLKAIIVDYYLNFIPYFANLFSPLFTFIAVIFFTSKLADRSEIIAMLASGMSFRRLMLPYAVSATIIAIVTFILNAYIIPRRMRLVSISRTNISVTRRWIT